MQILVKEHLCPPGLDQALMQTMRVLTRPPLSHPVTLACNLLLRISGSATPHIADCTRSRHTGRVAREICGVSGSDADQRAICTYVEHVQRESQLLLHLRVKFCFVRPPLSLSGDCTAHGTA